MKLRLKNSLSTKQIAAIAVFIALNIVFVRFLAINPTPITRIGLGNIPIILSGMVLGPFAGLIVGGISDFIGAIFFSGTGFYYPPLTLAPMLLGAITGLAWNKFVSNKKVYNIIILICAAELITEFGWKTLCLSWLQKIPYWSALGERAPFLFLIIVVDVTVICFLLKQNITKLIRREI